MPNQCQLAPASLPAFGNHFCIWHFFAFTLHHIALQSWWQIHCNNSLHSSCVVVFVSLLSTILVVFFWTRWVLSNSIETCLPFFSVVASNLFQFLCCADLLAHQCQNFTWSQCLMWSQFLNFMWSQLLMWSHFLMHFMWSQFLLWSHLLNFLWSQF